jgi:RND family efflux transporter MFP subunit
MKMRTVLKVSAVPAILLVGLFAMQALGSTKKEANKRAAPPEARAVETQRVQFADLKLQVEGNGVVESERTLNMISEANGRVTFAKNDLKDGTFVRMGEMLVAIDSRDVANELYGLRSDFMNAVASVLPELRLDDARIYKRWFDYFNALDIDKAIPDLPEITNAQEKMKVSTKDIIGKYYSVRNQEILLSKHSIRAPFDGYVSSNGVIENSFVSIGQQLFTLTDPKNVVVSVPLLVEESQSIDFSSVPKVAIFADESSEEQKAGKILRKETMVDRNSQTVNVYVSFTNKELDPNFLPGSYVHVAIQGKLLRDVAPVPRHLLDSQNFIFTLEDGTLSRQQLEVVAYQGDQAIVRNTASGETIVVTTILQKPLVGMDIRSINMPELNPEPELAEDTEAEPGSDASAELAGEASAGSTTTAGG